MRKLSGVCGVTNKIAVQPRVDPANVKRKIEAALERHTEIEAKAIRVSVKKGNTVVLEGKVDNWDERRAVEHAAWSAPGVAYVEEIEKTTSDYDREKLEERLAKLSGGVAVIRVGAPAEAEMKAKKEALDDAISSTKAAVAEGIVPGGGLALLRCVEAVAREEAACEVR